MTRLPWETSRADLARAIRAALKGAGFKNYSVRSGRPGATNCLSVYVSHWMYEPGGQDVPARTKAHMAIRELVEPILPKGLRLTVSVRASR